MNNLNRSTIIGLVLLTVGCFLVLNNLGLIPWPLRRYIFQWENILILIGGILLISKQNIKVGALLVGLGAFFSLDHWFGLYVSIFDLWPVVFVIAGIYIITRSRKTDSFNPDDQTSNHDTIDDTAIFGGGDRVMTSSNFRGGNLTAIFGGSNIDLTSCQLAEGESVLDVFYMFGGSKIRVPQDWNVHLSVTGIFGGMSDKRTLVDPDKYATKTLYVKGIALFGGAELTN